MSAANPGGLGKAATPIDTVRINSYKSAVIQGKDPPMKRWLALFLLLASSTGCMLFDDMGYHDVPPWEMHSTVEPPLGTCGQTIRNVYSQTGEPELLR